MDMNGYDRFTQDVISAAQEHWQPDVDLRKEELGQVMLNHLLNLDGPKQLRTVLTPRQQYFSRVFRGFMEIGRSLEILDDICLYLRRFPFKGTSVPGERYLQFHVETHFSEIYILKERLNAYITLFERQFRRDPRIMEREWKRMHMLIDKSLEGPVAIRGGHVHRVRFNDDDIDRLSSIALLTSGSGELSELMRQYYRAEYKTVRNKWAKTVLDNTNAIRKVLDSFFESLRPIVFDKQTSRLRVPRGIR